jgi:tetratricopeptide (TPR) repeat protein
MDRRGVLANEETFKTLAALAIDESERDRFIALLSAAGLRPTADVIQPLIARSEDPEDGLAWLEKMGRLRVEPNAETLTTLLQKADSYSQAVDLFDRLTSSVEPNAGAFKVLVDRSPDFETALGWVERMRIEGMRPEVGVLTLLLGKEPGDWEGERLLRWYLALDHHPSGPMMTAIETHRMAGRTVDALRLALDYPHLQPARDLFRLHPDETIAYLSELLAEDPGHPNGQYAMGLALLDLGRMEEAISHLELAKELARPGPRIAAIEEIIRSAQPV